MPRPKAEYRVRLEALAAELGWTGEVAPSTPIEARRQAEQDYTRALRAARDGNWLQARAAVSAAVKAVERPKPAVERQDPDHVELRSRLDKAWQAARQATGEEDPFWPQWEAWWAVLGRGLTRIERTSGDERVKFYTEAMD